MAITLSEYCNVKERARDLGLVVPTGLAILPRNYDKANVADELLHESSATSLRSLFRQNNIEETRIEKPGQKIPVIQENAFKVIFPIIFMSYSILSQNPNLLEVCLDIIKVYATAFLKGCPGGNKIKLDVIVEKSSTKSSKRIHYEGPPDGLKEIKEIALGVIHDKSN